MEHFTSFGRLFLKFIVDCYAVMEAWRLNEILRHRGTVRADLYSGYKMQLLREIMILL